MHLAFEISACVVDVYSSMPTNSERSAATAPLPRQSQRASCTFKSLLVDSHLPWCERYHGPARVRIDAAMPQKRPTRGKSGDLSPKCHTKIVPTAQEPGRVSDRQQRQVDDYSLELHKSRRPQDLRRPSSSSSSATCGQFVSPAHAE